MKSSVTGNTVHGNVGDVNSNNIEVNGLVFDVNINPKAAESRKELADWVSPLDFSSFLAQALGKRTPGTLEWLVASPAFMNWRGRRGCFLWCPGPPGAGKTVFASFVIDLLQKASSQDPSSVSAVCYIYCQYSRKLSVLELFEVLLRQLILWCPSVEIEKIEKMKEQGRRLPLDEVTALLQSNFHRYPGMFVVVDALDECFSESERRHLLQRLRTFSDVNILTSSRDLPHIAESMQGVARLDICAIEGDVNIHVDVQRQRNPQFAKLADKLSVPDLSKQVVAKAGHSFLLADLHISSLSEQTNMNDLKRALDTLPTDAAASHASAIGRINQQNERDKCLAYTVLSLVSYAFRPFTSLELRHAAANIGFDKVTEDDDLADEERIVSVCAGLITVNQVSEEVGFIHYTVQEYLQENRQTPNFLSEADITKTFMRLVCSPGMVAWPPSNHPLIRYAASSWANHLRRSENNESVVGMALSLLADSANAEILCLNWDPYWRARYGHDSGVRAIHLVAAFGLTQTGKLFLQRNPQSLDQQDCKGRTPLSWAAGNGHLDTVLMLFEAGNVRTLPTGSASLQLILRRGLNEINWLLWQKVQVDRKDLWGRTPLSYAAENGHPELVKMLLDTGKAEIDMKDRGGETPLSYAAKKGSLEVVKMLINTGEANVNVQDEYGLTPLFLALKSSHPEVIKILINTGKVRIDVKDNVGGTPLSYAVDNSHPEVVKMLLNTEKVDINAKDKDGRTLLSLAARYCRLEVLKVLLDTRKVEIDTKDNFGQTPLSLAAEYGHLEVVKLLLGTGKVDINAKNNSCRTPLSYAADYGRLEVVKTLLETGKADVDATDRWGDSPLEYARRHGHSEIVKLLKDHHHHP